MVIELTTNQISEIQEELKKLKKEQNDLQEKSKNEHVSGWDFVAINNQIMTLENLLKSGEIDTLEIN